MTITKDQWDKILANATTVVIETFDEEIVTTEYIKETIEILGSSPGKLGILLSLEEERLFGLIDGTIKPSYHEAVIIHLIHENPDNEKILYRMTMSENGMIYHDSTFAPSELSFFINELTNDYALAATNNGVLTREHLLKYKAIVNEIDKSLEALSEIKKTMIDEIVKIDPKNEVKEVFQNERYKN